MNTEKDSKQNSIGIVTTQYHTFSNPPDEFVFRCGRRLGPITLAYETYGTPNADKSNAVLILHALSGTAHAAGYLSDQGQYPGWWDLYIGPGKAFDTNKYFVICSNVLGGCNGSTGPSSVNPNTGKPFGLGFPMLTIDDMINAQKKLIDHLGVEKLLAVAGGSMGGMQALAWAITYPHFVNSVIAIATSASLSAQGIALNEVGRQAIINDPNWNNGDYYDGKGPDAGLSLARMIGHITYLSDKHMHEKFGRRLQNPVDDLQDRFTSSFEVESYLHHQGIKFVDRFDANTYLFITRAIDFFDLKNDYGTLTNAFEGVAANFLVVSFKSDWLYPNSQAKEIVQALRINGKNVIYSDIATDKGHDAFLLENRILEKNISNFLLREYEKLVK
jgi:homoserine O-acetyltransferase/O-succinyltransferase